MTDERLAEIRSHWATATGWYPASMSGYSYDTAVVVIDNAYAAITDLLQALAAAETRAARDAARLAAADVVVEAVRAWATDPVIPGEPDDAYFYREQIFEDAMIGALEDYDAATPRPDAGQGVG